VKEGIKYRVKVMERFPDILMRLYKSVDELAELFPGQPFTPDGHMISSIGEALAQYYYGVKINRLSTQGEDGNAECGPVEVKTTQRESVAFRCEPKTLLVLKLYSNGDFEEIYNGNGSRVWALINTEKKPSNGQYQVKLKNLRRLTIEVPPEEKLKMVRQKRIITTKT
jgi:hypothetical protein